MGQDEIRIFIITFYVVSLIDQDIIGDYTRKITCPPSAFVKEIRSEKEQIMKQNDFDYENTTLRTHHYIVL